MRRFFRFMWLRASLAYYERAIECLWARDPLNPDLAWLPIKVADLRDQINDLTMPDE